MPRRRLDHVDAMRPVKQAGVVSTHVLIYFVPASASVTAGAALMLLHVAREGFFFISACMLSYAYRDLRRAGLGRFYRRRLLSVAVPYLCWTVIYFLYTLPRTHYAGPAAALEHLAWLVPIGYYQLYFLLVIMQFYLVFPLVLMLLRRTSGHHAAVIAAAAVVQVALVTAMHWHLLPSLLSGVQAQREATTYPLYLIGGSVVAFHLDAVDGWLRRHARLVIGLTVLAALAAEAVYYLAQAGVTTALGAGDDPFQPSVIPFNVGAIACLYLAGVALANPRRSAWLRAAVRSGSDNSYGIYLAQMLFISGLTWIGWGRPGGALPWPLLCAVTVVLVYLACVALTSLLARTPLAVPLTGRPRQPWPAWSWALPRRIARPRRPERTEHDRDTRLDPVG
ncbi:MAG TPA: acyltransferase [Streptosporangiaceae bacterium]|jgi:peptidoglycan/LPS O-acetylase OafA/YrhL